MILFQWLKKVIYPITIFYNALLELVITFSSAFLADDNNEIKIDFNPTNDLEFFY